MKLLVLILNKADLTENVLEAFADNGIKGATVIDSTGMARVIGEYHDGVFLGSLRNFLDPEREHNKTIFTVIEDDQTEIVKKIIEDEIGDLSKPDTGILFTVPVDFVEGIARTDERKKD
ncbi:MAG: hypothetical protein II748_03845 [Clostridia bacterium]|nr:hypothetical protein [Clostridia bacterium]